MISLDNSHMHNQVLTRKPSSHPRYRVDLRRILEITTHVAALIIVCAYMTDNPQVRCRACQKPMSREPKQVCLPGEGNVKSAVTQFGNG